MLASLAFAPRTLALAVAALLAVSACGGSAASPTSVPGTGGVIATTPVATAAAPAATAAAPAPTVAVTEPAATGTGALGNAAANFSNITSFKFRIVMAGGSFGSLLGTEPITGMVTTNPKAAQMSLMGMEIIEVGGKTWVKLGTEWTESTGDSTSSIADSFAPDKLFASVLGGAEAAGYGAVGNEQKNGVMSVHYQADASVLGDYAEIFGVEGNATWSADVWVAKDGGYPVRMSVIATGGTESFQMTFDLTNVNDPSIRIVAPA